MVIKKRTDAPLLNTSGIGWYALSMFTLLSTGGWIGRIVERYRQGLNEYSGVVLDIYPAGLIRYGVIMPCNAIRYCNR